jgi:hypothetical protein
MKAKAHLPSHRELCRRAGFTLPKTYRDFLELCLETSPRDPWNAFKDLGLMQLDSETPLDPAFSPEWSIPPTAAAPPELVVCAWTGSAGFYHGFFVEEGAPAAGEHPIVTVSDPTDVRLSALSFGELLEQHCFAEDDSEFEERTKKFQKLLRKGMDIRPGAWTRFERRREGERRNRGQEFLDGLKAALASAPADAEEIIVDLPSHCHERGTDVETAWATRIGRMRLRQGCVPTVDGIGARLPEETIDREYIAGLSWPSRDSRPRSGAPDLSRLTEARRRLEAGEPGTALVLARNIRHLHWYDDWKSGRRCLCETGEILEEAYRRLKRRRAAHNIRVQTDWDLANVT